MSFNTEYVAKKMAENLKADLICLEPEEAYPDSGFKKYYWGGKSALMKDEPVLKKYVFDSNKYDKVIFGTPVWASCYTPPLRTFMSENKEKLLGKKICAFVCYSGLGASKALGKLKRDLKIDDFKASLALIDSKDKMSSEKNLKIEEFCNRIKDL